MQIFKMAQRCLCGKYVLLILGILLGVAAVITVIFGYVIPMIQSSDYTLESCKVVSTDVTQNGDYQGMATLSYLSLTKTIEVVHSSSQTYVQAYLGANYRANSAVQCLVSSDDIKVSIFISSVGLVFTIILAIASALCIGIYCIIAIKHKFKRSQYDDLDMINRQKPV